nr:lipocalin family protein [Klebsiella pneumoniae]
MRILPVVAAVTAAFLVVACSSPTPPKGVTVVNNFDAKRYLGTWYEIARFDHRFERGLDKVTATYSLRDDGGGEAVFGSTRRCQLYTKSWAVTGSPLDHFASLRRWKVQTLKSLLSQLSATPGIGWPSFGEVFSKPSNRSRLILASGTPSILFGSSDCGSAPLLRTRVCFSASCTPAGTSAAIAILPAISADSTPAAIKRFLVMMVIVL